VTEPWQSPVTVPDTKMTLGDCISVRQKFVITRSRALIGSSAFEKTPWTLERTKDWETRKQKLEYWKTETSDLIKKYWVLNVNEPSDWIIDHSAIFGNNPFTYTILKYCSTGDTQQVRNLENRVDELSKKTRFWMPACLKQTWNCEMSEIPRFSFFWEVFCVPCSKEKGNSVTLRTRPQSVSCPGGLSGPNRRVG